MSTSNVHHGVVHGKTIELDDSPGLPDGQEVLVTVETRQQESGDSASEEGLRRAFGAWADDADGLDEFLRWNRGQRSAGRREISP